jgi:hypothetical protein
MKHRRAHIDLWLSLLETIRPAGLAMTQTQIADYIGCGTMVVYTAERSAIAKMQRAAKRRERGLRR